MISRAFSYFLILLLASLPGFAQSSSHAATQSGTAAVMPKGPTELMLLAARVNGLSSISTQPWHVKANFQTFDKDGKPKDKGVFEEWWAGPEKYKVSYLSNGFSQTEYRNGKDDLITGDADWPPSAELMAKRLLLDPLPSLDEIGAQKYTGNKAKVGPVAMECLRLAAPPERTALFTFCIDTQIPALRIEAEYAGHTAYLNSIVKAGGHYLARQIRVQRDGKPYLNEDVTVLNFPSKIKESEFIAPVSAVSAPGPPPRVEAEMLMGNRISGKDPRYPDDAKNGRIQGTVVLDAIITKEGKIDDLRVVSGPPMLRQSAMDGVYTWRYKPYLLNGQPVEVETQINVVYTLGP